MKALYIYNQHASREVQLIEKVQNQLGSYVTLIDISNATQELRNLVRATPALIFAPDYLQGEELLKDGVDGEILVLAEMYKKLEQDELAIHNQETQRLDQFVKSENTKAVDGAILDMVEGGIL